MSGAINISDRFCADGEYPCPVCRHGTIRGMPLMEVFACQFCQHIFTTNFDRQLLKMADSQLPLTWYWNGKGWKGIQRESAESGGRYAIAAVAFLVLPTAIVALGGYLFPTLPGTPLSWLPFFWMILTFLAHLFCLMWLVVEYYQLPIFLYFQALRRRVIGN